MKDIQLVSMGNGEYDWNFRDNDLVTVSGNDMIYSSVIHAIMLHENELEQQVYKGKGCEAHNYIKLGPTDENLGKINDAILKSVNSITGVADSSIEYVKEEGVVEIRKITVRMEDGREVVINAISV